jgi:transposase
MPPHSRAWTGCGSASPGSWRGVRSTLYIASVVAMQCNQTFKAAAQNMRQRGKPNKLIITAITRRIIIIINAAIQSGQPCRQLD